MGMRVRRVQKRLPEYRKVKALYRSAFPADERIPFWLFMWKAKRKGVDFLSFYEGAQWVGFSYIISVPGLSYVFFLAVDDMVRGSGYGSRILTIIKRHYAGNRIFLAIEQLDPKAGNYKQRLKRRSFYEKNGFAFLGQKVKEGNVTYQLMGIGGSVDGKEYKRLMSGYLGRLFGKFVKIEG